MKNTIVILLSLIIGFPYGFWGVETSTDSIDEDTNDEELTAMQLEFEYEAEELFDSFNILRVESGIEMREFLYSCTKIDGNEAELDEDIVLKLVLNAKHKIKIEGYSTDFFVITNFFGCRLREENENDNEKEVVMHFYHLPGSCLCGSSSFDDDQEVDKSKKYYGSCYRLNPTDIKALIDKNHDTPYRISYDYTPMSCNLHPISETINLIELEISSGKPYLKFSDGQVALVDVANNLLGSHCLPEYLRSFQYLFSYFTAEDVQIHLNNMFNKMEENNCEIPDDDDDIWEIIVKKYLKPNKNVNKVEITDITEILDIFPQGQEHFYVFAFDVEEENFQVLCHEKTIAKKYISRQISELEESEDGRKLDVIGYLGDKTRESSTYLMECNNQQNFKVGNLLQLEVNIQTNKIHQLTN